MSLVEADEFVIPDIPDPSDEFPATNRPIQPYVSAGNYQVGPYVPSV